jgi:hypothetical protein
MPLSHCAPPRVGAEQATQADAAVKAVLAGRTEEVPGFGSADHLRGGDSGAGVECSNLL